VDQYRPHIVAKAIVDLAKKRNLKLISCTQLEEIAGHEISANLNGDQIIVGQLKGSKPDWVTLNNPLQVAVQRNGELIGVIGLNDPIRTESKELVSELRSVGVKHIALVTGDREESAQEVADSVGITEIYSKVTAQGKLEITQTAMKNSTGTVVVVGDGINDAPALAAANVGVAMGARGASAASEAADVVIVEDSIDRLTRAIKIAKRAKRKALQAAGIGMLLSFLVMITASFGITNASQGAVAQEIIDLIAIMWALTTLNYRSFTK
jgi:cation transport ATPase